MIGMERVLKLLYQQSEFEASLIIKGKRMGSYLLKAQLQMQSTGASFCMVLWSNNHQLLSKIILLIFFPCLHQLIKLFQSKENFKEKVDLGSNWKATWPRMISFFKTIFIFIFKVISIFKIIIRVCKNIFELCGKTSKFLPKRCLFIFCTFYLNKEELIQQVCLKDIQKITFFNSTLHKTKKQTKRSKNIIQLHHYNF